MGHHALVSGIKLNLFTISQIHQSLRGQYLILQDMEMMPRIQISRSSYAPNAQQGPKLLLPKLHNSKAQSFIPSEHPCRLLSTIPKTHLLVQDHQTLDPGKLGIFLLYGVDKGLQVMRLALVLARDALGERNGGLVAGHYFRFSVLVACLRARFCGGAGGRINFGWHMSGDVLEVVAEFYARGVSWEEGAESSLDSTYELWLSCSCQGQVAALQDDLRCRTWLMKARCYV